MAIYNTSQTNKGGVRHSSEGFARTEIALVAIVALTTAMIDNANDEVGLFWAPLGFVCTGIDFDCTDLDDGTALVWDVGDDGDEDRLIAGATTGQAAGSSVALVSTTGKLYKYTAATLIKAYVKTAAGTPVAGTLKVILRGFVDPEFSTTALVAA